MMMINMMMMVDMMMMDMMDEWHNLRVSIMCSLKIVFGDGLEIVD